MEPVVGPVGRQARACTAVPTPARDRTTTTAEPSTAEPVAGQTSCRSAVAVAAGSTAGQLAAAGTAEYVGPVVSDQRGGVTPRSKNVKVAHWLSSEK